MLEIKDLVHFSAYDINDTPLSFDYAVEKIEEKKCCSY